MKVIILIPHEMILEPAGLGPLVPRGPRPAVFEEKGISLKEAQSSKRRKIKDIGDGGVLF